MNRKSIIFSICLFVFPLLLCGCQYPYEGYDGEYSQVYTMACYGLFFSEGSREAPDRFYDPTVDLLEEDEYGRKLFCYYEGQMYFESNHCKEILSLLICQKEDENYVYFYPDVNGLSTFTEKDREIRTTGHVPDPLSEFDATEIEAFKERNDWGCNFESEKCIKREFIKFKPHIDIEKQTVLDLCNDLVDMTQYNFLSLNYMDDDDYGRKLLGVVLYSNDGIFYRNYYAVIVNSDFTYDKNTFGKELFGPFNCYEELRELKENNNWNKDL